MKLFPLALLALVIVLDPALRAQGGPPPQAGKGQHRGVSREADTDDLAALERFLSMSDEQLDQLQKAIVRVRGMTPEARKGLLKKMADYERLPAEQREQVKAGWGWLSDKDRSDWPLMMHSRSEDERNTIQTELQSLPPAQRAARKHALLEAWRTADPNRH